MIYQQKNGLFVVRVTKYINGKQLDRKFRNIPTRGEARNIERAQLAELEELKRLTENGAGTWKEARTEFLAYYKEAVAYSTYYTYEKSLCLHTAEWDQKLVSTITTMDVKQLLEREHASSAAATKVSFIKHVRAVFSRQLIMGTIKSNPVAGKLVDKQKNNNLQAMTRQEILKLLSYAKETSSPWYSIFRVTYELGLRSGEAVALQWTDVDFENMKIFINKSYCSKSKSFKPPKNGEPRTIVLNEKLAEFLKQLKLNTHSTGFVLPRLSKWIRGEAAKHLRQMQQELKLRQANYHSLRASFITHLLLDGVPVTKVQYLVGHKDLATTQRYVRLIASDLQGATDSLAMDLDSDAKVIQLSTAK